MECTKCGKNDGRYNTKLGFLCSECYEDTLNRADDSTVRCSECGRIIISGDYYATSEDNRTFCVRCFTSHSNLNNDSVSHQKTMSMVQEINNEKSEELNSELDSNSSNHDIGKVASIISGIIGVILICLSFYLFYCGFDKKDNYLSSVTNAYVGGDAYNYIINGTYFSGYMAMGSGILVSGVGLLCTGLIIGTRRNK